MDLRQLEAFAAVISAGSITGAARLLGRSQPALTRLIQELEETLGFSVLHRSGPRVTPTERGLRFHQEVEPVITWLRQLRERAEAIAADKPRSLEIAAIASFAAGMLPAALARLGQDALPEQVHIRAALAEQVVQSVATHVAEIGVTSLPVDHPALEIHWIGEAPCVAAIRADDPLAASDTIPLASIEGRRLITMANPFRWRRRVDVALEQVGVRPASVLDANTSNTALMAARAGLGIAILEPVIAYGMPLEGVAIRKLDVPISFFWGVVTPYGRPLTPLVEGLVGALEALARETLPGFVKHPPTARDRLLADIFGPAPVAARTIGRTA
ncbi:LysR family transcriptional regulator [Bosea sp. BIWAKO-01]|uniref:LysR family transcriptional regulator n=1 Tax=Bosea sp. BIWAKO-01 TaxID=506668 RepID=UPI000852DE6D|nr:LysR family transcriptional regulator [Bosea sp. BIWAKO-01]GAU84548.1 transcriptional regulator of LysR family [Bosea sp. BIWAKO-01]